MELLNQTGKLMLAKDEKEGRYTLLQKDSSQNKSHKVDFEGTVLFKDFDLRSQKASNLSDKDGDSSKVSHTIMLNGLDSDK